MTIEEYILGYTAFASFVTSLSNIVNTLEEGVMSKIFRDTENHEAKQDLLFLSSPANCKIAFFFVLFLVTSVTTRRSDSQNGFGSQELCSIAVLTLKPIIFLLLSFSTLEPPKKWLQMIISCYCSFWKRRRGIT